MNSSPEPVLERDPLDVDPPRHQDHFLVLDVDALKRADAVGEREHLGLAERLGREPPTLAFVDHRRVEALLDRRPDRERRREVVAVDDEVGAVADPDLDDRREQLVGGVARRDVGETRLHAHPDERHQLPVLPHRVLGELAVTEPDPAFLVGACRVRLRQVHRHVDVVASRLERAFEDRRIQARVAGVEDDVRVDGARQLGDGLLRRGVDLGGHDAITAGVVLRRRDGGLRLGEVDVGDGDVLVRLTTRRDGHERRADPAGTHHEDAHRGDVNHVAKTMCPPVALPLIRSPQHFEWPAQRARQPG